MRILSEDEFVEYYRGLKQSVIGPQLKDGLLLSVSGSTSICEDVVPVV